MARSLDSTPAIDVAGLTVRYGPTVALNEVSFTAGLGSVLGILGPNGAGKTTLIRVMATQQPPTAGRVVIAGYDAVRDRREVQRRIGVTGQYASLDDDLTPAENLRLVGALLGLPAAATRERIDRLFDWLDLGPVRARRLGQLSGGTRRRVDLAAALVGSPEVVFLDEPTTGLDPLGRQRLWGLVADLAGEGCTIVLTTQYLEEADRLADQVLLLDRGTIVAAGTPAALKASTGGRIVATTLSDPNDAARARDALGRLDPRISAEGGGRVVAHARDAAHALGIVATLDRLAVPIDDLAISTPTLDDAFYALTTS